MSQDWLLLVPPESCYWALLPATLQREQIQYRFEESVPLNVDELYVSAVRLAGTDGQWLVCGMQRVRIDQLIAADPSKQGLWSINPQSLPSFIKAALGKADSESHILQSLNICQSYPVTKSRKQWQKYMLLLLLIGIITSTIIGLFAAQIRMKQAQAFATAQKHAELSVLQQAFPEQVSDLASGHTALITALRRLKQQQQIQQNNTTDYTKLAHALMAQWPNDDVMMINAITFQGDRLSIRGKAQTLDQAQALWQALQKLESEGFVWLADPLQTSKQREQILFDMALQRQNQAGVP